MPVLTTSIDPRSSAYLESRSVMLERLRDLADAIDQSRHGAPGRPTRGTNPAAPLNLRARERVELLIDRDTPLLELSPIAGFGSADPVGAGLITALGIVESTPCVIVADDPATSTPTPNRYTRAKVGRAAEIARLNGLPLINLLDTSVANARLPGTDHRLPARTGPVALTGRGIFCRERSQIAATGTPTLSIVFGQPTGLPCSTEGFEHTIAVRDPGAASTDELDDPHGPVPVAPALAQLPGTPRPVDVVAADERDAVRLARTVVARFGLRVPPAPCPADPPKYDPRGLLAVLPANPAVPGDPREILARVLDGSRFDEYRPTDGEALCAGWGTVHGYPIGILADTPDPPGDAEIRKAAHLVGLANLSGVPLLLLREGCNLVEDGTDRQRLIGQDGPTLTNRDLVANAVANARVPHLSIAVGGAPSAANGARLRFRWPSSTFTSSAELADDGVIDPRDTRTVVGICLAFMAAGGTSAARTGHGLPTTGTTANQAGAGQVRPGDGAERGRMGTGPARQRAASARSSAGYPALGNAVLTAFGANQRAER